MSSGRQEAGPIQEEALDHARLVAVRDVDALIELVGALKSARLRELGAARRTQRGS